MTSSSLLRTRFWLAVLSTLLFAICGASQERAKGTTKEDEDVLKIGPKDPYTGGDEELMKAAGVVAYGPFPWADFKTTADVDKVLGEGRILWMETAHFRFGLNLKSAPFPEDSKMRKPLQAELKELKELLPKVPERTRKVNPWLRMHLAARRCEAAYADLQKLLGVTDADFPDRGKESGQGPYLGQPDKFLVLMFQKKSDLARYADRFCNMKVDDSLRYYHTQSSQLLFGFAAEGLEGFDEAGLHAHMLYAVVHNLLNAYRGYYYQLPLWLEEGVAHWYSRKVHADTINVQILDTEAVAEDKQANWPVKVRRRAVHDGAFFTFEQMAAWEKFDEMGYHAHSQAWSRVDYLMQTDPEKLGLMITKLKSVPPIPGAQVPAAQIRTLAQKLLIELYELDGPTFDEKWREWVLKTYPKK
ncbi:MAG: hypothetical protein H6838_15925 [Planctomycetes bacterium]|nr:hypothetical protein [Planctomycetota bacterium]MCB9886981.1 hypothetical protein [Planctomycetota bacterium]